jgi:hypothetical protein
MYGDQQLISGNSKLLDLASLLWHNQATLKFEKTEMETSRLVNELSANPGW